jgi:hypothetical protein
VASAKASYDLSDPDPTAAANRPIVSLNCATVGAAADSIAVDYAGVAGAAGVPASPAGVASVGTK